ncbi:MAG: hypothetical protein VW963_03365, partial [Candidatus Neomarinimicrobiota bacterium]
GKLDTSKWVRPIQPAFITESLHQRINIKRGDILCQLSFYSPNIKEKIVLECQDNPPQKIVDLVNENTLTTRYVKNTMSLIDRGAELLKSALKK